MYNQPTPKPCSRDCRWKEVCVLQTSVAERAVLKPDGVVLRTNGLGGKAVAKCATYNEERRLRGTCAV